MIKYNKIKVIIIFSIQLITNIKLLIINKNQNNKNNNLNKIVILNQLKM